MVSGTGTNKIWELVSISRIGTTGLTAGWGPVKNPSPTMRGRRNVVFATKE